MMEQWRATPSEWTSSCQYAMVRTYNGEITPLTIENSHLIHDALALDPS